MSETKVQLEDHLKIKELISTNTLQEISVIYGVSRERIRQILLKYKITRQIRRVENLCSVCSKKVIHMRKIDSWVCPQCAVYARIHENNPETKKYYRKFQMGICIRCNKNPMRASGLCASCRVLKFAKDHPEYAEKQRISTVKYIKKRYSIDPEFREKASIRVKAWVAKNRDKVNLYQRQRYFNKKAYDYLYKYYKGIG